MATIISRSVLPLREGDARQNGSAALRPLWHRSAPKDVSRADGWQTGSEGWAAWSKYLSQRRRPQTVAALLQSKRAALLWGAPEFAAPSVASRLPATVDLLVALERLERGKPWKGPLAPGDLATAWVNEAEHRRGPSFGLECIAWCRALPPLASILMADQWWHLFDLLVHIADDAVANEHDLLARQWLAAELPLTLAYTFPEIKPTRELAAHGAQALSAGIATATAADGMPLAAQLHHVPALLATWGRARQLALSLHKSGWDAKSEERYTAFAQQVLRLLRRNGTVAFAATNAATIDRTLCQVAYAGLSRADRALAAEIVPGYEGPRGIAAKHLPPPDANSETAGVSLLRSSWSSSRERIAVARHGHHVRLELTSGRELLWSGDWTSEVRRNGELLVPEQDAEWDEVCWMSTEDGDYLEIEMALPCETRVQRQIFLARDDRFLFISDAVLGEEPATLEYRGVLPIVEDVTFDPSSETREGYLVGRKPRGLLLPLALPEWRVEPCGGELEATEAGLELRAAAHNARRLYAPLFLDLHPGRLFQPTTWRQLTVAENRQIVPRDLAVGYRVQVRNRHWLLYRSMGERGNRTLLGHNLVSDFLIARFKTDGEIEPLAEIE